MGTNALDGHRFNQSAHKEANQTQRFDGVSLGEKTENKSKGLDAG